MLPQTHRMRRAVPTLHLVVDFNLDSPRWAGLEPSNEYERIKEFLKKEVRLLKFRRVNKDVEFFDVGDYVLVVTNITSKPYEWYDALTRGALERVFDQDFENMPSQYGVSMNAEGVSVDWVVSKTLKKISNKFMSIPEGDDYDALEELGVIDPDGYYIRLVNYRGEYVSPDE